MGDAKVRTMDVASPTETIATSRKSGWFQFTDLDKKALIRRINARYNSGKDITIKLYANGDSSNSIFSGTLRANDGPTNPAMTVNTNSDTITDTTATTLKTNGTNILKTGDWIKIGNEIMKIVEAAFETSGGGTVSHTVQRGMRGTTAANHSNNTTLYYANYPNDSLRVGKRAKYAKVEISTAAGTTSTEINKLEIEYK